MGLSLLLIVPLAGIFRRARANAAITSGATQTLSVINAARVNTLASKFDTAWGVHLATSSIVLFRGVAYATSSLDNEVFKLDRLVNISGFSLASGGSDIIFNRLTGTTANYGNIILHTISSVASSTRVLTIKNTGTIY